MKKNLILFFCTLGTHFTFSQVTIINSPANYNGSSNGYQDSPIELSGELYTRYLGNDGNFDLFKYDGTSLIEIASPANFNGSGNGYMGLPILLNNVLYMQYKGNDGNFDLFKYDGTTLTEIPSPTNFNGSGNGYLGIPILFNNELYMQYKGNDGNFDLFKYNGNTLTEISSITNYTNSGEGYLGDPIIFNNALYLKYGKNLDFEAILKYDGTGFTEFPVINGGSESYQYRGEPFISGNNMYLRFRAVSNGNNILCISDGTNFNFIPSPANFDGNLKGYFGEPITFNGSVYLRYRANNNNHSLFKYDGTSLTQIANLPNFGSAYTGYMGGKKLIYKNELYLYYWDYNYTGYLIKCNGTSLTLIDNPANYATSGYGFSGDMEKNSNLLFVRYTKSGVGGFFTYDGINLTEVPNPTNYTYFGLSYTNKYNFLTFERDLPNDANILFRYKDGVLTEISGLSGFTYASAGNYGQGFELLIGTTLYFKFSDNNSNRLLVKLECTDCLTTSTIPGQEKISQNIEIYPNPLKSGMKIKTKDLVDEIVIIDALGKVKQTVVPEKTEIEIDLSNENSGLYFVKVIHNGQFEIAKIIKQD